MIWRWWDRFAAWWDWGTALIAALITCGVLFVGVAVYFFMHNHCAEWVDKPCTHSKCCFHFGSGYYSCGYYHLYSCCWWWNH